MMVMKIPQQYLTDCLFGKIGIDSICIDQTLEEKN